jgi:D-alanyl-D-alanine carboxypeptidase/D-alanyl-D-alanine-endopeptidase (penicillin-binding protein 4)
MSSLRPHRSTFVASAAVCALFVASPARASDKPIFVSGSIASPALAALSDVLVEPAKPDPEEARLRKELEEILRAPELSKVFVGVHVRSLSDGRTIFDHNGAKLFNPASNMKLLTTASALWYLGPSYRFRTEARRDPKMSDGVVDGNLYIKGFGDPTLTTEEVFGLVNELALAGITKVKGDLIVDDSFFDAVSEGPGWEQEHSDQAYAAPIGALAVDFGTFNIRVMPGAKVGAPAIVRVWPAIDNIEVAPTAETVGDGARPRIWIGTSKNGDKVRVAVRGTISAGDGDGVSVRRRVINPALFAGETIKLMLGMRGVEVKGKVKAGKMPRAGVVHVTTHFSKPLGEISSTLNKFSNNFMAEQILKTLAAELTEGPGSWDGGVEVMKKFLLEIGIQDGTFVLANGSGLNDVNRMTPAQLTRVLAAMHARFEVQPEFAASLAVAGASGTIGGRFDDSPAFARLRAKTGTLNGVSALSGYVVTKDEKVLAFSIVMNDYRGRARPMWRIQERIGNALARYKSPDVVAQP